MEFVDNAYKTGAGRYIQERNALDTFADEVNLLGKHPLLVTGPHCKRIALPLCEDALKQAEIMFEVIEYEGPVCYEEADKIVQATKNNDNDLVVGIGGGRILDQAKVAADQAGLPIICVPTSIATCCAYTPLSVMYFEDGSYRDCKRFYNEINAVIVDDRVMAEQPARLIAAGILDSIAKVPEVGHGTKDADLPMDNLQRYSALEMAKVNNKVLFELGLQAYDDANKKQYTDALDKIVFTNLALTGVVSALMRGYHQTALAHKFYDGCRGVFKSDVAKYLHGELVAIGLIMQTTYNGSLDQRAKVIEMMEAMNMPTSLFDLGIEETDSRIDALFHEVNVEEFVPRDADSQARLRQAFKTTITNNKRN